MKIVRVGTHSLVLVAADLVGIVGGALLAFRVLGVANQVWLQLPLAVVLSVSGFCVWVLLLEGLQWSGLRLGGLKERLACFGLALLWAPLVFVPLHYLTQHYWTSPGNLLALALYQLPVNALALASAAVLSKSNSASGG
jgi:hypothetical protein